MEVRTDGGLMVVRVIAPNRDGVVSAWSSLTTRDYAARRGSARVV